MFTYRYNENASNKRKINIVDQPAARTELVTLLSDTLSQVSADRLTNAITQAWRDPWVANLVFDNTSLTFDSTIYQYNIPATMTTIDAIYLQRDSTSFPEEVSGELWEVINGQIIFSEKAYLKIPSGYALQLRGRYKLTATDSISVSNQPMQNYVVALAGWIVLRGIGMTKILSFLHNDTSITELIGFRRELQADVNAYRAQLITAFANG